MLSTTIQKALAATLVDSGTTVLDAADGVLPTAVDVWLGSNSLGSFQARAQCPAAPVQGSSTSGGPRGNGHMQRSLSQGEEGCMYVSAL